MKQLFTFLFVLSALSILAQNRFTNDYELRKIYGFEYERMSDSLLPYLKNEQHKHHYTAIKSVASVQDTLLAIQLIFLLEKEKEDTVKHALINSLSQLDCYTSYWALFNYYTKCNSSNLKSVCLSAIGKIAQTDVTELYTISFSMNHKPEITFINNWLKGLYLAKRRKKIDSKKNNKQLLNYLDTILQNNLGNSDEVNFYYSKLVIYLQSLLLKYKNYRKK